MDTIYWASVRNQNKRESYIELEDLGKGKWAAVLGDKEFTFKTTATDFLGVLHAALTKHSTLTAA